MATLFSYFKKSPAPNNNNNIPTKKTKVDDQSPGTPLTTKRKEKLIIGDIVWAKLANYPFWPALVCKHPSTKKHLKNSFEVHVQFFGEPPTHDWVKVRSVLKCSFM